MCGMRVCVAQAAESNSPAAVELLLELGAKVDALDGSRCTPIMAACSSGAWQVCVYVCVCVSTRALHTSNLDLGPGSRYAVGEGTLMCSPLFQSSAALIYVISAYVFNLGALRMRIWTS